MNNYEKKYKDANNEVAARFGTNVAKEIFSDLYESEDDRIRKALISVFSYREKYLIDQSFGDITVSEALAWLEKQGEKTKPIEGFDNEFERQISHLIASAIDREHEYNESYVKRTANALLEYAKRELEKQGEQKPFDYDNAYILQKDFAPIEPKFKKGDWVILTAGELSATLQIVNFDTNKKRYWFNDNSYLLIVDEECLHHWTIEDAKPGDVLACDVDEKPFIFKGLLDPNHPNCPVAYCGINDDDYFSVSSGDSWWTDDSVKPATKEQRDTLFAKMRKVGYMWDAEKKELKKIPVIDEGKSEMD